jgi:membrane protease YdiL (CAAX protease family)
MAETIIGVVMYIVLISFYLQFLPPAYVPFWAMSYMIVLSIILCRGRVKRGYPLSLFGLTWRNWKASLLETFLFMIPLLLGMVVVKQILILFNANYANLPLFRLGLELPANTPLERFWLSLALIFYVFGAPVQELIFRGILQNSWQRFAIGSHRTFTAIIISNFAYMAVHFYWSYSFVVVIPGFLWGWLFARHRTLVGVAFGHTLFGVWIFYIVGLNI